MARYVWQGSPENGRLVPFEEAHSYGANRLLRSDLPFPSIRRDSMRDLWHPATDRMYDSKSDFRRATKRAGCVELGNDRIKPRRPERDRTIKDDVGRAIQKLNAGYKPAPV